MCGEKETTGRTEGGGVGFSLAHRWSAASSDDASVIAVAPEGVGLGPFVGPVKGIETSRRRVRQWWKQVRSRPPGAGGPGTSVLPQSLTLYRAADESWAAVLQGKDRAVWCRSRNTRNNWCRTPDSVLGVARKGVEPLAGVADCSEFIPAPQSYRTTPQRRPPMPI